MPRRPTRTVPTVLLPAPIEDQQNWQYWLAAELRGAGRQVRIADFDQPRPPRLADWSAVLHESLAGLPDDGFDLLAHSLSCLLWLHHAVAAAGSPRPARVALVAPPAPEQAALQWPDFCPVPLDVDALRRAADGTVLVGGDNDPYCPGGVAQIYGAGLKMAATVIAGAGSLSSEFGYGPWPAVLDWCGRDNLAFIG